MIEDIKKEIKNIHWVDLGVDECDKKTIAKLLKHQEFILKILDKYKDKEDKYKNAWEELREDNQLPIPFIELLSELMQNLEEKYGIEVK